MAGRGDNGDEDVADPTAASTNGLRTEADYRARAAKAYEAYSGALKSRFKWLPALFIKALAKDLLTDSQSLLQLLKLCGDWQCRCGYQAGATDRS
jgi:hypothetical protein